MAIPTNGEYSINDLEFLEFVYNTEKSLNNASPDSQTLLRLKGIINAIDNGFINKSSVSQMGTVNLNERNPNISRPAAENELYAFATPDFTGNLLASIFIAGQTFTGASSSSNQWKSPDNLNNGELLIEAAVGGTHLVSLAGVSIVSGNNYEISCYARKNTSYILQISGGTSGYGSVQYVDFNLNTGTVDAQALAVSYSIIPQGDGIYLCKAVFTATASVSSVHNYIMTNDLTNNGRVPSYTGSTSKYISIWGCKVKLA